MVSAYYRHEFTQGEHYAIDLDIKDNAGAIDTTGWTGESQIQTLDGALVGVFAVSFPILGTARLILTPSQTALLLPKRYLHDAKFTDAGNQPMYYLEGDVLVRRRITQ